MTTIIPFDELPRLVGSTFEIPAFRIHQDEVDAFEDLTGVTHIFKDFRVADYPSGMIEGFHSLSLVDYLTQSVVRPDPVTTYPLNYGINHVRFPSKMTVHDTLWYRSEITDVVPRGEGYVITYDIAVGVQGSDKPGLVVQWLMIVFERDAKVEVASSAAPARPTAFTPKLDGSENQPAAQAGAIDERRN